MMKVRLDWLPQIKYDYATQNIILYNTYFPLSNTLHHLHHILHIQNGTQHIIIYYIYQYTSQHVSNTPIKSISHY